MMKISDRIWMLAHLSIPVALAAGGVVLGSMAAPVIGVGAIGAAALMISGGAVGAFAGGVHCWTRFFGWGHSGQRLGYSQQYRSVAASLLKAPIKGVKGLFNSKANQKKTSCQLPSAKQTPPKP